MSVYIISDKVLEELCDMNFDRINAEFTWVWHGQLSRTCTEIEIRNSFYAVEQTPAEFASIRFRCLALNSSRATNSWSLNLTYWKNFEQKFKGLSWSEFCWRMNFATWCQPLLFKSRCSQGDGVRIRRYAHEIRRLMRAPIFSKCGKLNCSAWKIISLVNGNGKLCYVRFSQYFWRLSQNFVLSKYDKVIWWKFFLRWKVWLFEPIYWSSNFKNCNFELHFYWIDDNFVWITRQQQKSIKIIYHKR